LKIEYVDPISCVAFAVDEWECETVRDLGLSKLNLILWGYSLADTLFWCHAVPSKYSVFIKFEELWPFLRKGKEKMSVLGL